MPTIGINTAAVVAKNVLGIRNDPYANCNFHVEIQGVLAGGFAEVSGLEISTEVETYREGGLNTKQYRFPKWTTYSDLVLKKGVSDIDLLWRWYQNTVNGEIQRKSMTIYLLGPDYIPAMWWDVSQAWPSKMEGPSFDATSNQISFETLTITHEGLVKPVSSQVYSAAKGALTTVAGAVIP